MKRRLVRWIAILFLLSLPILVYEAYSSFAALPQKITVASGTSGGRYYDLAHQLAKRFREAHGVEVEVLETEGSLENLALLQKGRADFGFYQQGAFAPPESPLALEDSEKASPPRDVLLVGSLYREVVLLCVRDGAPIESPFDLRGARVSLGSASSGDHSVSRILLAYYGIPLEEIETSFLSYEALRDEFEKGALDAAFVSVGTTAPALEDLLASGLVHPISLPHRTGLIRRHLYLEPATVDPGSFTVAPNIVPRQRVETLSVRALLLTRSDRSRGLVGAMTELILDKTFDRQAGLAELFREGGEFGEEIADFSLHPGSREVFHPGLRPLLNSDFVEATEGIRSFVVSFLIALFLFLRWLRQMRIRSREHDLDRYIRAVLDIERRQVSLDADLSVEEAGVLEDLLDQVTELRQEALGEFTAHELREDRGAECLIAMCHALSDKIGGKLLRYRIDRVVAELRRTDGEARSTTQKSNPAAK